MLAFYISLSLIVSFICSMLEAVILSVSPSYLGSMEATNPKLYQSVKTLKEDIEKPLASILTFNTIAHTIGAAGAGAEAQKVFGNEALTIFSILLTLGILFLSEIIPKSIGANSWKSLLPLSIKVLKPMIIISAPLVYVSGLLSKLFQKKKDVMSRDEINAIADMGLSDGVIDDHEHRALKGLVKFSTTSVRETITKRDDVEGIRFDMSIDEAYQEIQKHTYNRIIVFGTTKDDLRGYILRSELSHLHVEKNGELKDIIKPVLIQSDELTVKTIFHRLLKRREHMASVVDEGGDFIGIVTLEDLLEELLGFEIFDELDLS